MTKTTKFNLTEQDIIYAIDEYIRKYQSVPEHTEISITFSCNEALGSAFEETSKIYSATAL